MTDIIEQLRKDFLKADTIRDADLETPSSIERVDNIQYGGDPKRHLLDVYYPRVQNKSKFPVIINVHGGGWVYGTKETYQYYCMSLAERGFTVVNFTYRLAPDFKFPAPLEDLNTVFEWIFENDESYPFDLENIFAVGDSAGAHSLATYANVLTNPSFKKSFDFEIPENLMLNAIGLNFGSYRMQFNKENPSEDLNYHLMQAYLSDGGTAEELEKMNVLNHVTSEFPPTFVMTGSADFLKDEAPLLSNRLFEEVVPHVLRLYGDHEEQLPHVFHCDIKLAVANRSNDDQCNFFKSNIR